MQYSHGAALVAKAAFTFKAPGARGRPVTVKPGARFWVTNTAQDQRRAGAVLIDREGRGCISHGYAFTPETIGQFFELA
jgi:hypothetical protein